MIKITIPNDNIPERKYAIDFYFKTVLGLKYEYDGFTEKQHTSIQLANRKQLIIQDRFFSKFKKEKSYLSEKNIPEICLYLSKKNIDLNIENNLPIIFGNTDISYKKDTIICGIDFFAAAFFMLTRWEEYVIKTRDKFGRFPAAASLAWKNNFLKRPILNEYAELIWHLLATLGIQQKRDKKKFKAYITHDVDLPLFWRHPFTIVKKIGGDIFKRNSLEGLKKNINSYWKHITKKIKRPL